MNRSPWALTTVAALVAGSLAVTAAAGLAPARSMELRGSTYFVKAPWKAELITYYDNTGDPSALYYLTISLDPQAGASLGRLTIQQTRGADWNFPFAPERTRAFLGRPRREGTAIPVQATFAQRERLITVDFPEPLAPGSTVTVELKPWYNPVTSDTYLFQVTAWPAGPQPVASPIGPATLRIYDRFPW
ncbi:MAG: DUF2808 domain-containing protein [Synechococcaceae cyanobacterium ELA263]